MTLQLIANVFHSISSRYSHIVNCLSKLNLSLIGLCRSLSHAFLNAVAPHDKDSSEEVTDRICNITEIELKLY